MALGENRYNVKVEFVAFDVKNRNEPISVAVNEWNDLPYLGLVQIQGLLIDVLKATNDWGKSVIEEKGMEIPPPKGAPK